MRACLQPSPVKEKIVGVKDSASLRPDEHPSKLPQVYKHSDGFKLQRSSESTRFYTARSPGGENLEGTTNSREEVQTQRPIVH